MIFLETFYIEKQNKNEQKHRHNNVIVQGTKGSAQQHCVLRLIHSNYT